MKKLFGIVGILLLIFLIHSCKKEDNVNVIKDVDGNVYTSVTIGTQEWMVENLKTTKYNDNTQIPNVTDDTEWAGLTTHAYCWYNNKTDNKFVFGALYNWYAVENGKLCPTGWHVPSDGEWALMENYLIANGYNYDGTTTDNKLGPALASINLWDASENKGAVGNTDYERKRNATGFSAIPAGTRYAGFCNLGWRGNWWSTTELSEGIAWGHNIDSDNAGESYCNLGKNCGLSIRCLKD